MRIVGGRLRGKKLMGPLDPKTRPTSDRAREALFNILSALLLKEGRTWAQVSFLDVFAGTGAVGIEALSRGARKVRLIENHPEALKVIRQNTAGLNGLQVSAVSALQPPLTTEPADVIFLDAPYREELWEKALFALRQNGWVTPSTLIVVEIEASEEGLLPGGFIKADDRRYGRGRFLFCRLSETAAR